MSRPIYQIAEEIKADWKKPYFGAVPYLSALHSFYGPTEKYGCDSATDIIAYFLANANTWRGETARRIKAELNGILKSAAKV